MTPERWERVKRLYDDARERQPGERSAFLAQACPGDEDLCRDVEALLDQPVATADFVNFVGGPAPVLAEQHGAGHGVASLTGRRLGVYQVQALLGRGGMGEVYRAHDTRLGRDVAIKFLPPAFTSDPDRLARFEREARMVAALNHPHIAAIYGVEESEGIRGLVLELVEGETMAERLARLAPSASPGLPLGEALAYARQIVEALEAAHEKGITHRDLKPANIKLTPDGVVKLLDFGIAKVVIGDGPGLDLTEAVTGGATIEGMIVGTAGYMSPEQARGKPVDKRSDIWAFGCVLFEMLSGRRAFSGETVSDTIAAILERDPDWTTLPADTPRTVRRLLQRCLGKDARQRLRDIGDARIEIEDAISGKTADTAPAAAAPLGKERHWRVIAVAALAVLLIGAAAVVLWWPRTDTSTSAPAPTSPRRLTGDAGLSAHPALSPDGRLVAFASDRAGERNLDIWVRQVAGGEPLRLTQQAGDETTPTFSPDGTQIAFRSGRDGGGIYAVSALGGEATLLAPEGYNPRFSPDGRWLAYQTGRPGATADGMLMFGGGRLYIMPATGGAAQQIHPEAAAIDLGVWSPDSQHVLARASFTSGVEPREWWVLPREDKPRQVNVQALQQRNMREMFPVAWLPGNRIVFTARLGDSRNTWIATLSSTDWQIVPPLQQVTFGSGTESGGSVAAGTSGTLALVFSSIVENIDLWSVPLARDSVQAAGPPVRLTHDVFPDRHPTLTSDGATLVYQTSRGGVWELWARDMTTGRTTRVVSMAPEYVGKPVLSPDGSRLAFWAFWPSGSTRPPEGVTNATYVTELRRGSDGTLLAGTLRRLPALGPEGSNWPWSWTPDARAVWYDTVRWPRLGPNHLYDVIKSERITEFQHAQRDLSSLLLSPDGRWLAFDDPVSEIAGRVIVTPVSEGRPSGEDQWIPITEPDSAATWHAWSAEGNLIYFQSARDGFICVWAQRLARGSMRPLGSPVAVYHSHTARLSIGSIGPNERGLAAAGDKVVFNMSEMTGNIWMTELTSER